MSSNPNAPFAARVRVQGDPAYDGFTITPGTSELQSMPRALYVGGAGNIVIVTAKDTELFLVGVQAGTTIPIVCKKVLAQGTDSPPSTTTATNIIGLL